jgi:uncharacterized membrane protein YqjE
MSSTGEPMPGLENQRTIGHMARNGWALRHAAAELQGDRVIVLAAVAQNGRALQFAAAELQGDREIVLAAVAQNGYALQFAAAELMGDREIVLAAVAQDGRALQFAAAELRRHRALGWICTTNVALHCAKLRLALATCALSTPLICSGGSPSALPMDLMELIGKCILPDVTMCVVARKYGYWYDVDTPTRGKEDPGRKKRKRFHDGDDVVE